MLVYAYYGNRKKNNRIVKFSILEWDLTTYLNFCIKSQFPIMLVFSSNYGRDTIQRKNIVHIASTFKTYIVHSHYSIKGTIIQFHSLYFIYQ